MRIIAMYIHLFSSNRPQERVLLRGIVLSVLTATMLTGLLTPHGAWSAEPEIVARVNGEVVTRKELLRMLGDPLEEGRLRQELPADNGDKNDLKRLSVRKLIHRRLFLQEAERRSFTVTDSELDLALTALRKRFNDLTDFGSWMHDRGLDDQSLLDTLRDQILMSRVWQALTEGVQVHDERIKEFYKDNREDLVIGEEVRLRIIAIRDEETAEEILEELRNGKSFSLLARKRSLGKRASKGGDTGWVNYQNLLPMLQQAVRMLQPGDVAGPLQKSPEVYLLVGLAGRRLLSAENLEQARPVIEQRFLAEERGNIVKAWLAEQEKKSEIEILF